MSQRSVSKIKVVRLEAEDDRPPFDCGDDDLNEFFNKDSRQGSLQLLAVTYLVLREGQLVAFFSVSNDSIKKEEVGGTAFKRVVAQLTKSKRYSSQPAVKIGRLAVAKDAQGSGLGRNILDFIKAWFTIGNKTGCRFIVVDAYAQSIDFYQKNGFALLSGNDQKEKTRLMYFDLITVISSGEAGPV